MQRKRSWFLLIDDDATAVTHKFSTASTAGVLSFLSGTLSSVKGNFKPVAGTLSSWSGTLRYTVSSQRAGSITGVSGIAGIGITVSLSGILIQTVWESTLAGLYLNVAREGAKIIAPTVHAVTASLQRLRAVLLPPPETEN